MGDSLIRRRLAFLLLGRNVLTNMGFTYHILAFVAKCESKRVPVARADAASLDASKTRRFLLVTLSILSE